MEIKIGKVELGLTANGTPKVYIFPEDADFNNTSEAIEVIGELESLYASTRKKGETVELIEKGKWKNLKINDEYIKAYNSQAYDRVKNLFKVSLIALNKSLNGNRTQLDIDTAKILLTNDLELFLKFQDETLKILKDSATDYSKEVVRNLKLPISEQTLNPYQELNKLTLQSINNISKEYKIVNSCEEVKTKSKPSK